MNGILELLTLVVYTLGCIGFGALTIRLLGWKIKRFNIVSPMVLLASEFLLGQGLLALLLNVLGVFAQFKSWIIWLVLAVGLLATLSTRKAACKLPNQIKRVFQDYVEETWGWRVLPILNGFVILLHSLLCAVPLTGWDAINIYMVESKLMAAAERLVILPGYENALTFGLMGEMHFGALMSLGTGTQTPRLFTLMIILAMALVLAGLGRKTGMGRRGQWIVVSLLFTSSVATNVISDGKVDLYGATLGVAAFFWASLSNSQDPDDKAIQRIAAVLASLAVIGKPTYIVSLVFPIVIFLTWRNLVTRVPKTLPQAFRQLIPLWFNLGIWMLLFQLPNIFKNTIIFREPLAPFIGHTGDEFLKQAWMSPDNVHRLLWVYPLALVLADYPHPVSQYGRLSFAVMALLPLGMLLPRPKHLLNNLLFHLGICAILGVIFWIALWPSIIVPRYFMAPLFILTLFPAKAAEAASRVHKWPLRMDWLVLVTLFITFYAFMNWNLETYYPLSIVKKQILGHFIHFLEQNDRQSCDPIIERLCGWQESINQTVKPGERVFIAHPRPIFWLRPDLIMCTNSYRMDQIGPDLQDNWRELIEHGYTWLVIWKDQPEESLFIQPGKMPDWIELKLFEETDSVEIYRIQNHSKEIKPKLTCESTNSRFWKVMTVSP